MTLNEIASWLHKEYDIPYRKALSIAAKMIKEGAYDKPREEVEQIAKAEAGVEDITISGEGEEGDDFFGGGYKEDDATAQTELDARFEAIGMGYLGEAGLLGLMAGALSELKNIILETFSPSDAMAALDDNGYDDSYFAGLFEPSSGIWSYRNAQGKVKLEEWMADIATMMSTCFGISASQESLYYQSLRTFL